MSFEFYGGILALQLLTKELHAPREQAESVAEAVFRHQDLGTEGKITVLGQVLQMATVFGEPALLCPPSILNVFFFPRLFTLPLFPKFFLLPSSCCIFLITMYILHFTLCF